MEWSGVHPVLGSVLKKLPVVPSLVPIYKTTVTTTVDETTSTFTGVDIGVEHPNRVIILCVFLGAGQITVPSATVNGYDPYSRVTSIGANNNCSVIFLHKVTCGSTATITVTTASGSLRKAVSVYVYYPGNLLPLDTGTITANTTTDANLADLKVQAGGCLIYCGSQLATLGTFTTTWTGVDAVVEDVDAQLEAASSYTAGHINITRSTDLDDLNLAESTSGTKALTAVTLGPPYLGAYPTTV